MTTRDRGSRLKGNLESWHRGVHVTFFSRVLCKMTRLSLPLTGQPGIANLTSNPTMIKAVLQII